MTGKPWRTIDDRLLLRVRLTPRASRDGVDGIGETALGPALEARVRAVADKGGANAALEELIARSLKLPKSAVVMTAGFRSRIKTLAIAGEPWLLSARLEKQFDKPAQDLSRPETRDGRLTCLRASSMGKPPPAR